MNSQAISLRKRTFKAGSWVLIGHLFSQFVRLGGNLILTRLLVPEMFGVMAIANMVMVGLAMFSNLGLLQNIVQSERGDEYAYVNTAWTIQIIKGFLIFFIALTISAALYFFGQFGYLSHEIAYGNTELPAILAVMSLTTVIGGFNSIQLQLLNRKLMMGKLVMIEIISQLVGLVFMVFWAWRTHDIWALVFGTVISSGTKMILSHAVNIGERCQFCWDREAAKEIIHFGKWIFISSILGFMLKQGDRLLLGGLINAEMLGIYSIAYFLATALQELLTKLISSVFFPVLSETNRNNPSKLESLYYKIKYKIDAITMFAAGFLYSTGSYIVDILYGSRYSEAGWMLEVLSISLISVGSTLASQCFFATGKPKLETVQTIVQLLNLYLLLPISFYLYGMKGAVWMVALTPLTRSLFSLILMKKYLFIRIKAEIFGLPFIAIGWLVGGAAREMLGGILNHI